MTAEMVAPAWMHTQISAEQYDSWSEEQCMRHRDRGRAGRREPERLEETQAAGPDPGQCPGRRRGPG